MKKLSKMPTRMGETVGIDLGDKDRLPACSRRMNAANGFQSALF
jgi:hypothetical protein